MLNTKNTGMMMIVVGSMMAISGVASAQLINPANLRQSPDGGNKDVADLLSARGYTTSVGTVGDGDALNFGDQIANELFSPCSTAATMTWAIQWQEAGYASWHKVGYYTPGDPSNVTWMVGGSASGLASTATFVAPNVFGLALYSGDTRRNTGGTVYYSQSSLNAGGLDHLAAFIERGPNKPEGLCSIIVS